MPTDEVVELSVEETNALRAELGLAPLRVSNAAPIPLETNNTDGGDQQELLELSVDGTNELRKKLGLAPLRDIEKTDDGRSARQAVHMPAVNTGEKDEIKKRMERSKLKRQVQEGIASTFAEKSLGEEEGSTAMSWAAKMRLQKNQPKKKKKKNASKQSLETEYTERDLEGMDVSHGLSELEAGSTTIMTLADAPLLKTRDDQSSKVLGLNENAQTLENVELSERQVQQEGLRKKREAELGMGRAGGYAGFDDDEFEELGGAQGPSRLTRGQAGPKSGGKGKKGPGFKIGAAVSVENSGEDDLFAFQEGKAVSLVPTQADVTASDFMTAEEDSLLHKSKKKKKKKDTKFKKKKKKEKRHQRKEIEESDEETHQKSLLDTLEETAVSKISSGRKRRRSDSDGEETKDAAAIASTKNSLPADNVSKRSKYDEIMEKGNLRTALAFKQKPKEVKPSVDEEPDDAFLDAALAKARRLRRLKEISKDQKNGLTTGADAVVLEVQSSKSHRKDENTSNGGVAFAVNDTREFTRALRIRAEQAERRELKKNQGKSESGDNTAKKEPTDSVAPTNEDAMDEDVDMEELAKDVTEEPVSQTGGFDDTTTSSVPMGRGLAGALGMLKHTGEITGKHAGKEELRGRANDERTYEDYEKLDLNKVVKIGRGATEKDLEFANREIKLEYRDEHGRLLTRKEAYRELCYQFHGHGSGSKNEERKLRQIARERAEGRVASQAIADGSSGTGTTLGALKATQKATGKAFVVHRT